MDIEFVIDDRLASTLKAAGIRHLPIAAPNCALNVGDRVTFAEGHKVAFMVTGRWLKYREPPDEPTWFVMLGLAPTHPLDDAFLFPEPR